jgi:hypothetical protein
MNQQIGIVPGRWHFVLVPNDFKEMIQKRRAIITSHSKRHHGSSLLGNDKS